MPRKKEAPKLDPHAVERYQQSLAEARARAPKTAPAAPPPDAPAPDKPQGTV